MIHVIIFFEKGPSSDRFYCTRIQSTDPLTFPIILCYHQLLFLLYSEIILIAH